MLWGRSTECLLGKDLVVPVKAQRVASFEPICHQQSCSSRPSPRGSADGKHPISTAQCDAGQMQDGHVQTQCAQILPQRVPELTDTRCRSLRVPGGLGKCVEDVQNRTAGAFPGRGCLWQKAAQSPSLCVSSSGEMLGRRAPCHHSLGFPDRGVAAQHRVSRACPRGPGQGQAVLLGGKSPCAACPCRSEGQAATDIIRVSSVAVSLFPSLLVGSVISWVRVASCISILRLEIQPDTVRLQAPPSKREPGRGLLLGERSPDSRHL